MDIAQAPYMRAAALDPAGLDAAIQDLGRKKPQSVVPADQLVQDATPPHYSLGLIWETQEKAR